MNILLPKAGVALPPLGSVSAQGHELQMATNCSGYCLLTLLLLLTLLKDAGGTSAGMVRVT